MQASQAIKFEFITDATQAGQRIDQVLAQLYPDYSRARWQQWISDGAVLINLKSTSNKYKLRDGDQVTVNAELILPSLHDLPQAMNLNIVYEDEDLIIINKPIGLVVHPAAGNRQGTLLNALLHHAPELTKLPRAGIVHRLDKDTSGLLMIARNLKSYTYLVKKLQAREIGREYIALVQGKLTAGGKIDAPMGRHPTHRTKMAVLVMQGKTAITHYRIAERFPHYTLLNVKLETGRTHQIRVHFAHIKHPLVGDPTYGGRLQLPRGASEPLINALRKFKRQALHAYKLSLIHPRSKELCEWTVPIPKDFEELLAVVRSEDIQNK